jgi:hypothetical protein
MNDVAQFVRELSQLAARHDCLLRKHTILSAALLVVVDLAGDAAGVSFTDGLPARPDARRN